MVEHFVDFGRTDGRLKPKCSKSISYKYVKWPRLGAQIIKFVSNNQLYTIYKNYVWEQKETKKLKVRE